MRNIWHSCGRFKLADHLEGKLPAARRIFNRVRAIARECGPVTIYAQKSRIVFQVRVRFANAVVRKRRVDIGLWLTRRIEHPALHSVDVIAPNCYAHTFRMHDETDVDDEFAKLFGEAYLVGQQEHLDLD
jgi:hypothetical protein